MIFIYTLILSGLLIYQIVDGKEAHEKMMSNFDKIIDNNKNMTKSIGEEVADLQFSVSRIGARLDSFGKNVKEGNSTLNELILHQTADYRAANPEANAAFFEEYPEATELEQMTFDDILRERVNKEYE